jgi:hypothetical protein
MEDEFKRVSKRLAWLLYERRNKFGASQRQVADFCALHSSVVSRLERGGDARISTWIKIFGSLGCRFTFEMEESCDDNEEFHRDEALMRKERRAEGLRIFRGH